MERRSFLSVLGMAPVVAIPGVMKHIEQQTPQRVQSTNSMKVIDTHVHVVDSGVPVPQLMKDLHEGFLACGFDAMCFAVNTCEGFHAIHRNLLAFVYKYLYPDHGYVHASLDYHIPGSNTPEWDFGLQAERLINIGADGFKMYEGKPNARKTCGNIPLTSWRYGGFYDLLEKRGIPLALHIADPPDFWERDKARASQVESDWFFADVTYSTWQEIYDECIAIITNYPKLRIILPQFAYLTATHIEELMHRFPNLYIDTNTGDLNREVDTFRRIAMNFSDRLIFACSGVTTDLAGATAKKARGMIDGLNGLGLRNDMMAAILNGNFLKICPKRPVNKAALKEYAGVIKKSLDGFPAKTADQATVQRTMEVIRFIEGL